MSSSLVVAYQMWSHRGGCAWGQPDGCTGRECGQAAAQVGGHAAARPVAGRLRVGRSAMRPMVAGGSQALAAQRRGVGAESVHALARGRLNRATAGHDQRRRNVADRVIQARLQDLVVVRPCAPILRSWVQSRFGAAACTPPRHPAGFHGPLHFRSRCQSKSTCSGIPPDAECDEHQQHREDAPWIRAAPSHTPVCCTKVVSKDCCFCVARSRYASLIVAMARSKDPCARL